MEPYLLRGAERILIVISALVCIILGYGLFKISYSRAGGSNAEMTAKGVGFEITLRHVWPGVFFAAFGMIVLVTSVLTQLKIPGTSTAGPEAQVGSYQGGGIPPPNSKVLTINAISAIGEMLAIEPLSAASDPKRSAIVSRLATAQVNLVDVAYGQGSFDKFTDIASRAKNPADFAAASKQDREFYEDLRTTLQK